VARQQIGSRLAVAIVGGSGSGKSRLSDKLASVFSPGARRLSLDEFYWDRSHILASRRDTLNFDNPRAVDWKAFEQKLGRLLAGKSVRLPRYDFTTHARLAETRLVKPAPVIVADGLWLLRWRSLRRLFDFKVFIECSARARLGRRLGRDCLTRGGTAASIRKQFHRTVEPMHQKYVIPQRRHADVILSGNFGISEVRLLKSRIKALRAPQRVLGATPPRRQPLVFRHAHRHGGAV
jgi:uridine kinase